VRGLGRLFGWSAGWAEEERKWVVGRGGGKEQARGKAALAFFSFSSFSKTFFK